MSLKLLIFDLDGVLCDASVHEKACLRAIQDVYGINISSEQYNAYGTIPTLYRLNNLANDGIISHDLIQICHDKKQELTKELVNDVIIPDKTIHVLKNMGEDFQLAVGSNAHSWFVNTVLTNNGVSSLFSTVVSADDVEHPKPAPDIFLKCLKDTGVDRTESIIFEDSRAGIVAAINSEIRCILVDNIYELGNQIISVIKNENYNADVRSWTKV